MWLAYCHSPPFTLLKVSNPQRARVATMGEEFKVSWWQIFSYPTWKWCICKYRDVSCHSESHPLTHLTPVDWMDAAQRRAMLLSLWRCMKKIPSTMPTSCLQETARPVGEVWRGGGGGGDSSPSVFFSAVCESRFSILNQCPMWKTLGRERECDRQLLWGSVVCPR